MSELFAKALTSHLLELLAVVSAFVESDAVQISARITHEGFSWIGLGLNRFYDLLRNWLVNQVDQNSFLTLFHSLLFGLLWSILIIFVMTFAYLVLNVRRWRRARIFISYQHAFEDIALDIQKRLDLKYINPIKLPFLESPEHDSLLDEVKHGISGSDLVVCIPGEKPSFVEHEVAMAFVLEKPLLFLATNDFLSRIPDTAKRGYPIINLNSLDEGGWNSFRRFCIYVSMCNIALINDCLSIIGRYNVMFAFTAIYLVLCYLLSLKLFSGFTGSGSFIIVAVKYAIAISTILITVAFYLRHMIQRTAAAKEIRRIIGRQSFTLDMMPSILMYKLTRTDVIDILFKGSASADHERVKNISLSKGVAKFTSGKKVAPDLNKVEMAAELRKSADQGDADAQYNLGLLFEKGDYLEQNSTRAAHWFLKAAEQGHALAQNAVAELYHKGRGVEQDYMVALKWYEAAANQGNASAAYNAGWIYFTGLHVKRDRNKARALFEKSAEASFILAECALGVMYENGLGVRKNKSKAKNFYEAAAAAGDKEAQESLKRLSKSVWKFWK